jgi:hypothetical protein
LNRQVKGRQKEANQEGNKERNGKEKEWEG